MIIKTIETEEQYESVLAQIYDLIQIDNKEDSECDELERLCTMVEKYEKIHYPFSKPKL